MKTLFNRLLAETPKFWKKVRRYAVSIGTACVAVVTINVTMTLGIDATIINIASYTIAACAAIAGTASFTTTDK